MSPTWFDYAKQLPPNLPDEAYDAQRQAFYMRYVRPEVLRAGFNDEQGLIDFMSKTTRPGRSSYPRLQLAGKAALTSLVAPITSKEVNEELMSGARLEAEKQGVGTVLPEIAGTLAGVTPYFLPAVKGVQSGAKALALATRFGKTVEQVEKTAKISETLMMPPAIGLVQGAYDAAREESGARGFAVGFGLGLVGELITPLWRLLRGKHALTGESAKAVEAVVNGSATEGQQVQAAEAILRNPTIKDTVAQHTTDRLKGAKQFLGKFEIEDEIVPDAKGLTLKLKLPDGTTQELKDLEPKLFKETAQVSSKIVGAGGTIIGISGKARQIQMFRRALGSVVSEEVPMKVPIVREGTEETVTQVVDDAPVTIDELIEPTPEQQLRITKPVRDPFDVRPIAEGEQSVELAPNLPDRTNISKVAQELLELSKGEGPKAEAAKQRLESLGEVLIPEDTSVAPPTQVATPIPLKDKIRKGTSLVAFEMANGTTTRHFSKEAATIHFDYEDTFGTVNLSPDRSMGVVMMEDTSKAMRVEFDEWSPAGIKRTINEAVGKLMGGTAPVEKLVKKIGFEKMPYTDQLEYLPNGMVRDKKTGQTYFSQRRALEAKGLIERQAARDPFRVKQMAEMYEAGKSFTEIGEEFGVTRQRVHQILTSDYPDLVIRREKPGAPRTFEWEKAVAMYSNGKTVREIAEELGTTENAIHHAITQLGAERRGHLPGPHLLARRIDRSKVVDLYTSGKTMGQVADELGVSKISVFRILHQEGINVVAPPRTPRLDYDRIVEMYQSGKTTVEIAEELGSSSAAINFALQKRGVPRRPRFLRPGEVERQAAKDPFGKPSRRGFLKSVGGAAAKSVTTQPIADVSTVEGLLKAAEHNKGALNLLKQLYSLHLKHSSTRVPSYMREVFEFKDMDLKNGIIRLIGFDHSGPETKQVRKIRDVESFVDILSGSFSEPRQIDLLGRLYGKVSKEEFMEAAVDILGDSSAQDFVKFFGDEFTATSHHAEILDKVLKLFPDFEKPVRAYLSLVKNGASGRVKRGAYDYDDELAEQLFGTDGIPTLRQILDREVSSIDAVKTLELADKNSIEAINRRIYTDNADFEVEEEKIWDDVERRQSLEDRAKSTPQQTLTPGTELQPWSPRGFGPPLPIGAGGGEGILERYSVGRRGFLKSAGGAALNIPSKASIERLAKAAAADNKPAVGLLQQLYDKIRHIGFEESYGEPDLTPSVFTNLFGDVFKVLETGPEGEKATRYLDISSIASEIVGYGDEDTTFDLLSKLYGKIPKEEFRSAVLDHLGDRSVRDFYFFLEKLGDKGNKIVNLFPGMKKLTTRYGKILKKGAGDPEFEDMIAVETNEGSINLPSLKSLENNPEFVEISLEKLDELENIGNQFVKARERAKTLGGTATPGMELQKWSPRGFGPPLPVGAEGQGGVLERYSTGRRGFLKNVLGGAAGAANIGGVAKAAEAGNSAAGKVLNDLVRQYTGGNIEDISNGMITIATKYLGFDEISRPVKIIRPVDSIVSFLETYSEGDSYGIINSALDLLGGEWDSQLKRTLTKQEVSLLASELKSLFSPLDLYNSTAPSDRKLLGELISRDIPKLFEAFDAAKRQGVDLHRLSTEEPNVKNLLKKLESQGFTNTQRYLDTTTPGMELARTPLGLGETGEGGILTRYSTRLGPNRPITEAPTSALTTVDRPKWKRTTAPSWDKDEVVGAVTRLRQGEKPHIVYSDQTLNKSTIAHETFHALIWGIGQAKNLELHVRGTEMGKKLMQAFAPEVRKMYDKSWGEEIYTYLQHAIRTNDIETLEAFVEADESYEKVLSFAADTTRHVLGLAEDAPDSLYKRALERRLNYVLLKGGTMQDLAKYVDGAGDKIDFDGEYFILDLGDVTKRFKDRDSLTKFLDEMFSPSLTEQYLDDDLISGEAKRFAVNGGRGGALFSPKRRPKRSDPVSPDVAAYGRPEGGRVRGGFQAISFFGTPFYSWLSTVAQKNNWPGLYTLFGVELKEAGARYDARLARVASDILATGVSDLPRGKRIDIANYMATPQANKVVVARDLNLTSKELEIAGKLRQLFDKGYQDLGIKAPYVEDYIFRFNNPDFDVNSLRQTGRYAKGDIDFVADHIRTKELDLSDRDVLNNIYTYFRLGYKQRELGDVMKRAAEVVNMKTESGDFVLGTLQPLFKRHLDVMRGQPDYTAKMINGVWNTMLETLNDGIDKVNKVLPSNLKLSSFQPEDDVVRKWMTLSFAGTMGGRAIVLVRDMLQFMMTTYPILGEKYLTKSLALAHTKRNGKTWWEIAREHNAMMFENEMALMNTSASTLSEGGVTKFAKTMLKPLTWTNNVNRVVTFAGHTMMAEDATRAWLSHHDAKRFIKESGLWFADKQLQQHYLVNLANLKSNQLEEFSYKIARDMTELTQWNYHRGAGPGMHKYTMGKILGQYGTWPMNYWNYAKRVLTNGDRSDRILAGTRLALAHGLILKTAESFGVDAGQWVFTQPLAFAGSPVLQAAGNIPQALDIESDRGVAAREELSRFPFLQVPLGMQAQRLWRAWSDEDPDFWKIALGFQPMRGNESEEGVHAVLNFE